MFLRLSGMAKIFYTGSFRSWEALDCLQISCYFLQNMNTSQLCKYNIDVGRMISRKYTLTQYLFIFSDLEFFQQLCTLASSLCSWEPRNILLQFGERLFDLCCGIEFSVLLSLPGQSSHLQQNSSSPVYEKNC